MHARHYKLIALVLAIQLLLLLALTTWSRDNWGIPEMVAYISVYVLPFIAYIVILYDSPGFERMRSIEKMVCLTLLSITGTMAGSFVIALLAMLLSPIFGVPIRR